jgi:hypothetical protein
MKAKAPKKKHEFKFSLFFCESARTCFNARNLPSEKYLLMNVEKKSIAFDHRRQQKKKRRKNSAFEDGHILFYDAVCFRVNLHCRHMYQIFSRLCYELFK